MRKIFQIKIKNFKAFQQEQVFDLKGKHVLAYGNNGSGKSSFCMNLNYRKPSSGCKNQKNIWMLDMDYEPGNAKQGE